MDTPSHSGKITWNNLAKALQRCLKENSNQRNNPAMAPNRMKWHQQIYQRLPDKEQAYSLRWQGCQSKQMDMLEWLVEGRNIGVNPAKITRMIVWSLESGGIEGMEDTSEMMKRQKLLIQGSRHDAKSHTEVTGKEKSHKQTQDGVGTAEGLIKIITEESVLACLDLGRPLGPGKDTLAYGIGMTLFQRKKNRQKASKNCFSVDLRRMRQGHDDQKEENLITATRLHFRVHSQGGSPHETYIQVNYANLQSQCVKLPRGLSVRLERFQVMAIVWERRKMLPAELR
jgi:hypothetical protein